MNVTAGDCIGPFEIKSLLGEGGMGVVFHARNTALQREAQVLASLNHPNIARIYGADYPTLLSGSTPGTLLGTPA